MVKIIGFGDRLFSFKFLFYYLFMVMRFWVYYFFKFRFFRLLWESEIFYRENVREENTIFEDRSVRIFNVLCI